MSTIGDLFVRLGVDLTTLNRDLARAETRFEKFGTQLFFLGSRVTAGVTLPMTAAGVAIGKLGLDFDKAMTESLAIMEGADTKIRKNLEGVAIAVSESTKFAASEAAEGFRHLISAGIDSADELAGALPIAAKFAQAGLMDLGKATEYLAGAQAALGEKTSDTEQNLANMTRISNVLTAANNRALGTVEDYAAALSNRAGAALRQMNKDAEEGVAVLMAFHDQNIKGKTAGQQLWMVMRDLSTYALKNAEDFKKHGISVFDATGKMKNMADIIGQIERATSKLTQAQQTQMFTELGIPLRSVAATKALMGYSDKIRQNEAFLRNLGDTTEDVANRQMQAMWNRLMQLRHQFENVAIGIFNSFVPAIEKYVVPLAYKALDAFRALGSAIDAMPDAMKALVLGGAGVVAVIGPLVAMTGSLSLLMGASYRGIITLTGGWANLATTLGLAAGGINYAAMTTAQLQAAQTMAAKSAIANALAQGQSAFQANAAGAAALAATRRIQQQGIAAATAGKAISSASGKFALFGVGIADVVSKLGTFGGWVLKTAGNLFKWYAIIEILTPAIQELFTGWSDESTKTSESAGLLSKSVGVLSGAFKLLNDVTTVAGGILGESVKALIDPLKYAYKDLGKEIKTTSDQQTDLSSTFVRSAPNFAVVEGVLNLFGVEVEDVTKLIQKLIDKWELLVLIMENRKLPSMDEMAEQMRQQALNKAYAAQLKATMPQKAGIEQWMLGSNKDWEQFKRRNGRYPWETDVSDTGTDLEVPTKPARLSADERQFDDLRKQLLGVNDEAARLKTVWDSLTPAQKSNRDVTMNLWEAYSKVRGEVGGMIPEFEKMFSQQLLQLDITARLAEPVKDWTDTWSDAAKEFTAQAGHIYVAMLEMGGGGAQTMAFWKQHEGVMDELIPRYRELSPTVQNLIDRYLAWKAALPPGKEFVDAANRAKQEMNSLVADVAAKNADLESEIHQFSETAGDTHRRTLKTKLAQIRTDQEQEYQKRLADLSRFTGAERDEYMKMLQTLKSDQTKYIANVERSETLRYLAAIGVNARIIRDHKNKTQEELNEIAKRQEAWNRFYHKLQSAAEGIGGLGKIFEAFGGKDLAEAFGVLAQSTQGITDGIKKIQQSGGDLGAIVAGLGDIALNARQAWKAVSDLGTKGERVLSLAATGWQIGNQFVPGWGGIVGAGIGALIGAFTGDPDWKQAQDAVKKMWGQKISKELAKKIDEDSKMLGGHVNAMMMNLVAIAEETDPISTANVGRWAMRLADTFNIYNRGAMDASQASRTLEASFNTLLDAGTSSTGFVNKSITELVRLERQYNLGTKAIRAFADSQVDLATTGFNKVVEGVFGGALKEQTPEGPLSARTLENQALDVKRLTGPEGQAAFDRMARLASVMFDAALASGKGLFDTIAAMGPALDTLSKAQTTFGLASNDSVNRLMKFRDFANLNPELVGMLDGLSQMMVGLTNLGLMSQQSVIDLGATLTSTYDEMIAKGLDSSEAMEAMHTPLQRLWELQQMFGFAVDDSTQALLDEAEASGNVGRQYMTANDRMVLGIDTLISRFDLFLQHLGIHIPQAADAAARAIEDGLGNLSPEIHVRFRFDDPDLSGLPSDVDYQSPTMLAEGAVLDRPTFVAGEKGAEVVMPLDRLFDELDAARRAELSQEEKIIKLYLDGRQIAEASVPHLYRVFRRYGIA